MNNYKTHFELIIHQAHFSNFSSEEKQERKKKKKGEREKKKKIIWRRCCITHCRFTLHNDYDKIILTMIIFILFGAFYFYYHISMYIFITVTKPCPNQKNDENV